MAKERSDKFNHLAPTNREYICHKTVRGLRFFFVANRFDSRVELYIDRPSKEANKAIFDQIIEHKPEIEDQFDETLSWERLDNRVASRIGYRFQGGIKSDELNIQSLQISMIEAMERLDDALTGYLPSK